MKKNKKVVAVVGTLVAFGGLTASAAALGGLSSTSLGADQTVVASCDTNGIAMAYVNAHDVATNQYRTTAVDLSGVAAACNGQTLRLTVSSGTAVLNETTATVTLGTGTTQTVTLSAPVQARDLVKASLVITGGTPASTGTVSTPAP